MSIFDQNFSRWFYVKPDMLAYGSFYVVFFFQMIKAPAAGKSVPGAASSSKQATISDDEIERQLRALGVD